MKKIFKDNSFNMVEAYKCTCSCTCSCSCSGYFSKSSTSGDVADDNAVSPETNVDSND